MNRLTGRLLRGWSVGRRNTEIGSLGCMSFLSDIPILQSDIRFCDHLGVFSLPLSPVGGRRTRGGVWAVRLEANPHRILTRCPGRRRWWRRRRWRRRSGGFARERVFRLVTCRGDPPPGAPGAPGVLLLAHTIFLICSILGFLGCGCEAWTHACIAECWPTPGGSDSSRVCFPARL